MSIQVFWAVEFKFDVHFEKNRHFGRILEQFFKNIEKIIAKNDEICRNKYQK